MNCRDFHILFFLYLLRDLPWEYTSSHTVTCCWICTDLPEYVQIAYRGKISIYSTSSQAELSNYMLYLVIFGNTYKLLNNEYVVRGMCIQPTKQCKIAILLIVLLTLLGTFQQYQVLGSSSSQISAQLQTQWHSI